ncbi:MAG TPA: LysR family transcriptional regulator [Gryllotalpicola sp.]
MQASANRYVALLALAHSGSITAAARRLGVTPSAISQQLAKLGREEGAKLVERGPRGVSLTASGRILAASAERIEAELADARRRLAELNGGLTGIVTAGGFQTAIRGILVPLMRGLPERHPGLRLRIVEGDAEQIDRWLREGDIDVAVIEHDADVDPATPDGMRDIPLLDDPWRIVLPAGAAAPRDLASLAGQQWLGASPGGASARALARLEAMAGVHFSTRHEYFEFSVALSLVAAAEGIALLPTLALIPPLPQGIAVAMLPGLGHRRLHLRVRTRRLDGPVSAIVSSAVETASHELGRLEGLVREHTTPSEA